MLNMYSEESPGYLRMSLAGAITLGFRRGRFYRNAALHCLNLLLTYTEGCRANCAYCGLSVERQGSYKTKSFIRVDWPTYTLEEILCRVHSQEHALKRICISMITNPQAVSDTKLVSQRILEAKLDLPLSLLIAPTILTLPDLAEFKKYGVDRVGIAIDAATEDIFHEMRGEGVKGPHRWETYWETVREALGVFGKKRVGVHLIAGLGETEKEMAGCIQRVHSMRAKTHLLSFYPETSSSLSHLSPPPMGQYRRIQLAQYLIEKNLVGADDISFSEDGNILDFRIDRVKLDEVVQSGRPFQTSGCPGCNRPYANSRPGPEIRNYPFAPQREDIERVSQQIWLR